MKLKQKIIFFFHFKIIFFFHHSNMPKELSDAEKLEAFDRKRLQINANYKRYYKSDKGRANKQKYNKMYYDKKKLEKSLKEKCDSTN